MPLEPYPLAISSPDPQSAVGLPITWKIQRRTGVTAGMSFAVELIKNGNTISILSQNYIVGLSVPDIDIYTFNAAKVLEHLPIPEEKADGTMFYDEEFFLNPQATALIEAKMFDYDNITEVPSGAGWGLNSINIYRCYPRRYEIINLSDARVLYTTSYAKRLVPRNGREFLTILAGASPTNAFVDCIAYFSDGSEYSFSYNLGSIPARGIATIEVSEDKIRSHFAAPIAKILTKWVVEVLSQTFTYEIIEEGEQIFWTNRLGGIDSFTFNVSRIQETTAEQAVFRLYPDMRKKTYGIIPVEKRTFFARYLDRDTLDGMKDLAAARKIWYLTKNLYMLPVTAVGTQITEDSDSNLHTFKIELEL